VGCQRILNVMQKSAASIVFSLLFLLLTGALYWDAYWELIWSALAITGLAYGGAKKASVRSDAFSGSLHRTAFDKA